MAEREEVEVCVIGAGIAGAIVADELGRRGVRVLLLDAGPRHDPGQRYAAMQQSLAGVSPWQGPAARDVYTNAGAYPYPLNQYRVKAVGGTTLHWTALTPRFHETDFAMRKRYGIADDWPISYAELEPYYGRAEVALGVSGADDNPFASFRSTPYPLSPFPFSYGDRFVTRAIDRLRITVHHPPFARGTVPYEGRSACQAFATCASHHVCPIAAQYTAETHVRRAEETGRVQVLPETTVLRLNADRGRRIDSATVTDAAGKQREIGAKVFVLAAHAVESARLLLLSESSRFPQGLANSSGMVGRHFMEHPGVAGRGWMSESAFPHRIGFHTAETHQFAVSEKRGDEGVFKISFLNDAGPLPAEIAASSGNWGTALLDEMRLQFGRYVGMRVDLEQLPDPTCTVTLDPEVKDSFGQPAPRLTYSVDAYTGEARKRAVRQMQQIFDAMGASDAIFSLDGEYTLCGHQIGTCRMGDDDQRSVVDRNLRAHDVENLYLVGSSVFVTSTPYNPTLTIAALALRAAQQIAAAGDSGRSA